jgi:hypothetical protein
MPKISKESYHYHPNRVDPEEFSFRVNNLSKCLYLYFNMNQDTETLQRELTRVDINTTCKKQMDQLKEFVNNTGMYYNNTYSHVDSNLEEIIKRGTKM